MLFPGRSGPCVAQRKQPFASRMGFSSEAAVAFLWSGTLRAFPHCPGGALRRTEVKSMRQDWMIAHKRAGEVSLHGPQGAGLGEEIDLHLISCK